MNIFVFLLYIRTYRLFHRAKDFTKKGKTLYKIAVISFYIVVLAIFRFNYLH